MISCNSMVYHPMDCSSLALYQYGKDDIIQAFKKNPVFDLISIQFIVLDEQ